MPKALTILAVLLPLLAAPAALLAQAPAAQKAEDKFGVCNKYADDAAKREACLKRMADHRATKKAKQDAARKELQDRIDAACANAPDKSKCAHEETAKLRKGKAKAKERAKKSSGS